MLNRIKLISVLVAVVWAVPVIPQVTSAPGVVLQDEGTGQGRVQILNCTGAGISCSRTGVTGTLSVSGGGGGSANVVQVSIDLGTSEGLIFSQTVTGQGWVTGTSVIVCTPFGTTADGQTPETVIAANVSASVSNLSAGVGFRLDVRSPNGATGIYRFNCTGA